MKPIGRVIFEAADRSANYPFVWDATLEMALLSGGQCNVRQGGLAFQVAGTTTPVVLTDAPVAMTVDPTPLLQALSVAVAALPKTTAPDATPAVAASQAAVLAAVGKVQAALTAPAAGALGNVALMATDGLGGVVEVTWSPLNPGDTPPTNITWNGAALTPVTKSAFGLS